MAGPVGCDDGGGILSLVAFCIDYFDRFHRAHAGECVFSLRVVDARTA